MNRIMTKPTKALFLLLFLFPVCIMAQSTGDLLTNIIPKPAFVKAALGRYYWLSPGQVISYNERFREQACLLQGLLAEQCAWKPELDSENHERIKGIHLIYDSVHITRPEMYRLTVTHKGIKIAAKDIPGMVHGIETLLQLLPLQKSQNIEVPDVTIEDYPRFSYRGMHLDVSRHFFGVDYIKKYLDYMAFYKFNTFHWHLTDDQGWRIEIEAYPRLTSFGAWRDSTLTGHFRDKPHRYDGKRYGGYYSQPEIKDIINYAAVRGITVIPEIDIPGHSRATIASYPQFSTSPDSAFDVGTTWGMFNRQNNVLAPNERTFTFLKRTFEEIADLFPSPYIHIGGDECSTMWWKNDPATQAFMKVHGLKDESALQTYFMDQVIGDLKLKGKKVIGWDEILEGGLDSSAIIMNWRGIKAAYKAIQDKHYVIMSPGSYTYLNYSQTRNDDSLTAGGYLPLQKVYDFDPVPENLNAADSKYILGAQGNVWTEYITNVPKLEYMLFPRMAALSEAFWTPVGQKDFRDFKRRIKDNAIPRFFFWGSNYFKNFDEPLQK